MQIKTSKDLRMTPQNLIMKLKKWSRRLRETKILQRMKGVIKDLSVIPVEAAVQMVIQVTHLMDIEIGTGQDIKKGKRNTENTQSIESIELTSHQADLAILQIRNMEKVREKRGDIGTEENIEILIYIYI